MDEDYTVKLVGNKFDRMLEPGDYSRPSNARVRFDIYVVDVDDPYLRWKFIHIHINLVACYKYTLILCL